MARGSGGFRGFGGFRHLAVRFFGSLRPGGPTPADEAWARSQLLPGERALWTGMSKADRRHAAGVARQVDRALGPGTERPVLAAALLHDVGKTASGLGTFGRVAATVTAAIAGRERVEEWSTAGARGWRHRMAAYFRHPTIGAASLAEAGSHELTIAWAREHHLPPERWTVPRREADALKAADDD